MGPVSAPSATEASSDALGAETPVSLTLEQSIELASEESYDARVQRLSLFQARQNLSAARGRFGLQATLSLDAPDIAENVSSFEDSLGRPVYVTSGVRRWQGSLRLDQPLPTNGNVGIQASAIERLDTIYDDDTEETDRTYTFFNSLRFSLSQPLFVPNGLKLGLERAQLELDRAERRYTRSQLDLVYQVTDAFYGVVRSRRALAIAEDEAEQKEAAHELARSKFEAGLIPEVEALQLEVDLASSQNAVLVRRSQVASALDRFRLAVGLPLDVPVDLDSAPQVTYVEVDEETAITAALATRTEIRDLDTQLRLAEITLAETDAHSTIRADVEAYYDLSGISDSELSGSSDVGDRWESSLEDLERRPNNRGVAVRVTVPIWDSGVNAAEVRAQRTVMEVQELDRDDLERRIVTEVRDAVVRVGEIRQRIGLLEKSQAVAERTYEISSSRFANGDITAQDLALDRDRLTRARVDYLNAAIDYQLALADLQRRTLYDFEGGRSLVD
jgi:outer membrane protein TolC